MDVISQANSEKSSEIDTVLAIASISSPTSSIGSAVDLFHPVYPESEGASKGRRFHNAARTINPPQFTDAYAKPST
jgi:hypothetical protein